eukprot:2918730-Pleurochrysis_carterae.AAC.1
MARPGMATIHIAWFKARLPGRPKEEKRQQSVHKVFARSRKAMQQYVDETLGLRRRKRYAPHTAEASAEAGDFARSQKRRGAGSASKRASPATGDAEEAKADA